MNTFKLDIYDKETREEIEKLRREIQDSITMFSYIVWKYGDTYKNDHFVEIDEKEYMDFILKSREGKMFLSRSAIDLGTNKFYFRIEENNS